MTAIAVTEAESEILSALWTDGPLSAPQLMAAVKRRNAWGDATIKTLLNRLMRKGAVKSDRSGGLVIYHPMVSRRDYVDAQVQALADRLFGGDRAALARFLDSGDLSKT